MKKIGFICAAIFLYANSAMAAGVEDRATQLQEQLNDNHTYDAYLARALASIAEDEKAQHDTGVAQAFMDLAEQHAQKAGMK